MFVRPPFGEPGQVIPHVLRIGVEDMRAIAGDQDPGRVLLVISVARDVVAAVDQQHALARLRRQPLRQHRAGKAHLPYRCFRRPFIQAPAAIVR